MQDLVFIPSFSLLPNKLISYNSVFRKDKINNELVPIQAKRKLEYVSSVKESEITENPQKQLFTDLLPQKVVRPKVASFVRVISDNSDNLKVERSSLVLSDNANRTMKKKINWLYYLAKAKKVKTYNGKEIFNFKIGFVTLTLPSKQRTSTKECNNNLLNVFLTEIRQRTKMENYLWRLEFQENGNVHYHIVTDTYLDYYLVKKIWNRILKNNGYIDSFAEKMNALTLSQYNQIYNKENKRDYSSIVKAYARGKAEKWQQPNSVDVKSVISNRAIANYITKYFSKDSKHNVIKNELDTDENSKNIRLWFCSRSLSKMNSVCNFCEAVEYDIFAIVSYCKDKKKIIGKYATSIYFELKNFTSLSRKWIEMILKSYAKQQNYLPAT